MKKLNNTEKLALYESIMNDVAKVVKKKLNESDLQLGNPELNNCYIVGNAITKTIYKICKTHTEAFEYFTKFVKSYWTEDHNSALVTIAPVIMTYGNACHLKYHYDGKL